MVLLIRNCYFNLILKSKVNAIVVPKYVSEEDCALLIEQSTNFCPSTITSGLVKSQSFNRTSMSMFYQDGENELIDKLKYKVSRFLKVKPTHFEPIQITKYNENQEYKYHYDYFQTSENQRKYTIIIYLNTVPIENGGATSFYFGNSIQPLCGTMVYWKNTNSKWKKIYNTLHSGKPIKGNYCKYIITMWTRHLPLI